MVLFGEIQIAQLLEIILYYLPHTRRTSVKAQNYQDVIDIYRWADTQITLDFYLQPKVARNKSNDKPNKPSYRWLPRGHYMSNLQDQVNAAMQILKKG